MTRKIIVPILFLLPTLISFGQNTDVELWLSAKINWDFEKKFRLYYEMGHRRDQNITETKTNYFEAGGFYKPWKFLWIGPYYRHYDDFMGSRNNNIAGVLILRE